MFCLGQRGKSGLHFDVRVWSGTGELSGLLVCLLFIPFIPKHCQEKNLTLFLFAAFRFMLWN